jgi:hypothetical protein
MTYENVPDLVGSTYAGLCPQASCAVQSGRFLPPQAWDSPVGALTYAIPRKSRRAANLAYRPAYVDFKGFRAVTQRGLSTSGGGPTYPFQW